MDDQVFSSEKSELQKSKQLLQWQNRLLPLMVSVPTVLIGAFIVLATLQLNKFEKFIYQGNEGKSENVIPSPVANTTDSVLKQNVDYLKIVFTGKNGRA